ncbi:hypothetical protein [Streptomyces hydrogenans]|uniref:hypothetical protein n=1 Tax=Streptomyces hydrogenans TaxID=1873719 RepID=UPI0038059A40
MSGSTGGVHERALHALGTEFVTAPLPNHPGAEAALLARFTDDLTGLHSWLVTPPPGPEDDREGLCAWARQRLLRLVEHGPAPDGWGERSDGGWQLVAYLRAVPRLDEPGLPIDLLDTPSTVRDAGTA